MNGKFRGKVNKSRVGRPPFCGVRSGWDALSALNGLNTSGLIGRPEIEMIGTQFCSLRRERVG